MQESKKGRKVSVGFYLDGTSVNIADLEYNSKWVDFEMRLTWEEYHEIDDLMHERHLAEAKCNDWLSRNKEKRLKKMKETGGIF